MQSDKASSERFLLSDEVAEVSFAKVSASVAITVLSQRREISSKVRICNFDISLIRKGDSVPSKSLHPSNISASHLVKAVRYVQSPVQSAPYFLQRSPHQ